MFPPELNPSILIKHVLFGWVRNSPLLCLTGSRLGAGCRHNSCSSLATASLRWLGKEASAFGPAPNLVAVVTGGFRMRLVDSPRKWGSAQQTLGMVEKQVSEPSAPQTHLNWASYLRAWNTLSSASPYLVPLFLYPLYLSLHTLFFHTVFTRTPPSTFASSMVSLSKLIISSYRSLWWTANRRLVTLMGEPTTGH